MGNIYEILIKAIIEQGLEENHLISEYQFGFPKVKSTADAVKWVIEKTNCTGFRWIARI